MYVSLNEEGFEERAFESPKASPRVSPKLSHRLRESHNSGSNSPVASEYTQHELLFAALNNDPNDPNEVYRGTSYLASLMKQDEGEERDLMEVYESGFAMLIQENGTG